MRLFIYDGVRYLLVSSTDEAIAEFHRQLPQIKADIQGMRNSQSSEQKWFHRQDSWDIKEAFGTTTVTIFSKSGGEKKRRVIEVPRQAITRYPVPVYDLVSGDPYGPDLARFWVGIDNHWYNPTLNQEVYPVTNDRRGTEFEETTYGDKFVYPLERIGEPYWILFPDDEERYFWSDENHSYSSSDPDTTWSPGGNYGEGGDLSNWPWLSDAWHGTVDPSNFQEVGTSEVIKECDIDGAIIRSDNLAHLEDELDLSGGLTSIRIGDTSLYNTAYYMYDWVTTYGYIISEMGYYIAGSCPFVISNTTYYTGTEEHRVIQQNGTRIGTINDTNSIVLGGETVISGNYDYSELVNFIWVPTSITGNVSLSIKDNTPYLLNDAVVYNAEGWNNYSSWCVVYESFNEDTTNSITVVNSDDGNWNSDYGTAKNNLNWPGVYRVIAKVAESDEQFILFESSYLDSWEFVAECYQCEIYDFDKKPVYIISVHIYKYDLAVGVYIYAMIYNNEVFISEEFETFASMYSDISVIYESLSRWNLTGYYWARAVGVKQIVNYTDTIEIEE